MAADVRPDERRQALNPSAAPPTIYALSSGQPPAAIGVIRISGSRAGHALERLAGPLPAPRKAVLRTLRGHDGEAIDRALLLWFPGPRTATGEDLAEIHAHGGRAVVAAIFAALQAIDGLRLAEPGEFTRRAHLNGRIDLAEAEGLADLLFAETEGQRRAALTLASGGLSRRVVHWHDELLQLSASLEAALDFADEDDVPDAILADLQARALDLADAIAHLLDTPPAERLRDGVRIVVAGPPNAGKSSLINALIEREVAIVSAEAGTTRDVIEAPVALAGVPMLLADTAGLRAAPGEVEAIGVARAEQRIATADIILWLGDPADRPQHPGTIVIHPRADLPGRSLPPDGADLAVSVHLGTGLDALRAMLVERAAALLPPPDALVLNRRQSGLAAEAVEALRTLPGHDPLLLAEHLRLARAALGRITGSHGTEAMLDALFGRFCIGK